MVWIECNWLHGRWGAVKTFIPDHIASQYRRFISFRCCLDKMQSCTSSTNLTICPIFGTYCTIVTIVTNQREVCMGVYMVLGVTTRNGQATRLKRAVAVVARCRSCLVSRSISNFRVVYALARRQQTSTICRTIKLKFT